MSTKKAKGTSMNQHHIPQEWKRLEETRHVMSSCRSVEIRHLFEAKRKALNSS